MNSLQDQVAIVTGGALGIGGAISRLLLANGGVEFVRQLDLVSVCWPPLFSLTTHPGRVTFPVLVHVMAVARLLQYFVRM